MPVVNDRLPTKEETSNGTSLIYVDIEKVSKLKTSWNNNAEIGYLLQWVY